MNETLSTWLWIATLGGAGGAVSAWMARQHGPRPALTSRMAPAGRAARWERLGRIAAAAAVAGATAAATAWMIESTAAAAGWIGPRTFSAAVAFFWIGFVTAGWLAAERDKRVLRQAVCRAATSPAAHPDTVRGLADASPDVIFDAVTALMPRRVVR